MFKTLRNILKTGDATVKYPFAPLETQPYMRGKPEHDQERCIACAACAVACPPNAIQMHTDQRGGTITWAIDYGRCIFCGRCEEVCPTEAIVLGSEFELAVMRKEDLEETVTYRLQACSRCGEFFAPAKEVDYAARLLAEQAPGGEAAEAIEALGVCPKCKRRADAIADAARQKAKPAAPGGAVASDAANAPGEVDVPGGSAAPGSASASSAATDEKGGN